MTRIVCHVSITLDGFMAGPDQSLDNPLGVGGERIHRWMFNEPLYDGDRAPLEDLQQRRGAYVMGRNMFGPIRGEWSGEWRGWWGEDPPYHAPVFVLTHYAHDPIEMEGGTTFHFVTGGFATALERAKEAAGEREVLIAGGASTVRQALAAGVIEELTFDIAPILLGSGVRPLDGLIDPGFEPIDVSQSPLATHIRYRVGG